jgi:hypothetical protein
MKRLILSVSGMGAAGLLLLCATRTAGQTIYAPSYEGAVAPANITTTEPSAASAWPVVFSSGITTYTIFEPQSDSWDGHDLEARSAVGVQSSGQVQPRYGVMSFSALTLVDKTTQSAKLVDIKITRADFPSAQAETPKYLAALRQEFPRHTPTLTLERLESSLTLSRTLPKPGRLNNTPPNIIVTTRPAELVSIDGPPAWRPVAGTTLQRVINTRFLLLKDQSGQCYLHLFDGYLEAPSLSGPWKVASAPPAGSAVAEKATVDAGQVDLMQGEPDAATRQAPSLKNSTPPEIFVETKPSELITFNGQPEYAPISGTELLYAANTSGNVFKELSDQQSYILLSGRWYRAATLQGPWEFVPGNELPGDFANIPDISPKENVKASVPGTVQAEEALIANSIPQGTAVARTAQMESPQIDGSMQLAAIEGTPLHYVENSPTPIIEVNPQAWYACQNGVWYASGSANGPWSVATAVPEAIYTIPTTSPLHYLTYVQVYGATPEQVYEGYTPGYLGTEVADDDTVVYGTGYDYAPWIGSDWYGPPMTWGCGFAPCWSPWCGWGFGCGFGWGCGFGGFGWCDLFPPFPWWGGFCGGGFFGRGFGHGFGHGFDHGFGHGGFDHGFGHGGFDHGFGGGHFANTAGDLYHHGGFGEAAFHGGAEHALSATGRQGFSGEFGHAYNSRTGQVAAGQRAQVQSVSGGAWNQTGRAGFAANNNSFGARSTFGAGSQARSWSAPSQGNYAFRGGNAFGGQAYGRVAPGYGGLRGGHAYRSAPAYGGFSRGYYNGGFASRGFASRGYSSGGFGGRSAFRGGGFSGGFRGGGGFHGGGGFGGGHGGGGGHR